MAPAIKLGSIGMSGQVIKNDHIKTMIIAQTTPTASHMHTALISLDPLDLVGILARKRGNNSERIAVNATTPR